MNHRQTVREVARRLPHRTQREVAEVLEVAADVWRDELVGGGVVQVIDLGRLSLVVQTLRRAGFLTDLPDQPEQVRRVVAHFRSAPELKAALLAGEETSS